MVSISSINKSFSTFLIGVAPFSFDSFLFISEIISFMVNSLSCDSCEGVSFNGSMYGDFGMC